MDNDFKIKDLAEFFGTTPQSLGNWKRSKKIGLNNRYKALEKYYKKHLKNKEKGE